MDLIVFAMSDMPLHNNGRELLSPTVVDDVHVRTWEIVIDQHVLMRVG